MKINHLTTSATLFFFISLIASGSLAKSKDASISFILGDIKIIRKGRPAKLKLGDSPLEGDIFRLKKKSIIEFELNTNNKKIKVTGPKIFTFKSNNLGQSISNGDALYNLFKKISKHTRHYCPRTIVSAVRTAKGNNDRLNEEGKNKIKKAIRYYKKGRLDKAWKELDKVEDISQLKSHTKSLISFYKAGILFKRMNYREALNIYLRLYRKRYTKFRHKEETLGQAIVCSVYTGRNDIAKELISEYKKIYGDRGAYWEFIKELNQI